MLALPPVSPHRVVLVAAVAARSLRAAGLQRLLGAPSGGTPSVGARRPEAGVGVLRWADRGRSRSGLGSPSDRISDPDHVVAAKVLRRRRIQIPPPPAESEVAVRRTLGDYDAVLGVDLDGGVA